jgi:hypothetical protein
VVSVSLIGMSLTSPLLLWIVAALAVIAPVVLIVVWGRGPGGIPGRLVRLVGIVPCQLLAVGAIGLYANSEYGFYNSWGELWVSRTRPRERSTSPTWCPPTDPRGG